MTNANENSTRLTIVDGQNLSIPCRHLRSKGMYVFSDSPEHEDHGNSHYWCLKTMTHFGPDDGLVARDDCHASGRTCHEPL
jgi:hypothetical protein